jgi:hypothetical protein
LAKESKKLARQICTIAFIILIGGISIAFLGAWNVLPVDPMFVVPATLFLLLVLGCAGSTSMASGISALAHRPFTIQPNTPDSGIWKRVVRDSLTGESHIIVGSDKTTFREALLTSWPFKNRDKDSNWIVNDDKNNDITYRLLSEIDCVADIVFE